MRATDPDGGDGGVVRYSITGATPRAAAVWFEINATTGDITLIQTLDREMNNVITLTVIASDLGQPGRLVAHTHTHRQTDTHSHTHTHTHTHTHSSYVSGQCPGDSNGCQ